MKKNTSISEEDLKRYGALLQRSIWQQFHDIFQRRAAEKGITKTDLAVCLGVDKSVITRRLNGTNNFTLEIISDLARALECKPVLKLTPYEDLSSGNAEPYVYQQTICTPKANTTSIHTARQEIKLHIPNVHIPNVGAKELVEVCS